jgi:hypothetical protein
VKKLVIALSLLGFSSAALACPDRETTTAKKEQKAPAVAKAAKKAQKSGAKKVEKKS